MGILLRAHSLNRWLVMAVAIIALIRFIIILLRKSEIHNADKLMVRVLDGLLGLQMLMGLVFLIWSGVSGAGFPLHRIAHAITMFVAVGVGGLPTRWQALPAPLFARNSILAIIGALALIGVGVALLPGGWNR